MPKKIKYVDPFGNKVSKKKATRKLIIEEIEGDAIHEKWTHIIRSENTIVFEGIFLKGKETIRDGYYKEFYYDGSVTLEENYVNNEREGESKKYHLNGQVYINTTYVNDRKVGPETEYNEDGVLVRKSNYNRKKTGEELLYFESGAIQEKNVYHRGRLEGLCETYYTSGAVREKNMYKEGRLEGLCKTFFKSGALESEKLYKSNKLQGESKTYYKEGGIHTSYNYVDNKKQGDFKEYYETGELESSGKMNLDKQHGDFNSFYKSGIKRRYEYYVDGETKEELGKCFAIDGSDTTYFPRLINPLINGQSLQKGIMKVLQSNFRYPEIAKAMGIQGKIYTSFVFTKDGKVDDIEITNIKPYNLDLAKEAIRLVKLIGEENIQHGFFEGKPAPIQYTLPVNFKLR